jgi:hypothetical protein
MSHARLSLRSGLAAGLVAVCAVAVLAACGGTPKAVGPTSAAAQATAEGQETTRAAASASAAVSTEACGALNEMSDTSQLPGQGSSVESLLKDPGALKTMMQKNATLLESAEPMLPADVQDAAKTMAQAYRSIASGSTAVPDSFMDANTKLMTWLTTHCLKRDVPGCDTLADLNLKMIASGQSDSENTMAVMIQAYQKLATQVPSMASAATTVVNGFTKAENGDTSVISSTGYLDAAKQIGTWYSATCTVK